MAKINQEFLVGGLMYVLLFAGGSEQIRGSDSDDKCGGEERWEQKVLTDSYVDSIYTTPKLTTIWDLSLINTTIKNNKYGKGKPRMQIEMQVYKIKHCFITDVLREKDNDLHLVIEDGDGHTMIAEIPDPECEDAQNSPWIDDFIDARETMLTYSNNYRHYLYTITGVLFVDRDHNQTGRASNNVEIHPVLNIKKEKKINPITQ